jgi:hypothetical protein
MNIWETENNDYYKAKNSFFEPYFDLTAYVEDESDISFWRDVFGKFASKLKLDFKYNSKDNLERGKQTLIKQHEDIKALGTSYILCLDSDLDYLLQDSFINNHDFVFQTYTYSVESYKINPQHLNSLCIEASQNATPIFNFEVFIKNLSQISYQLLLYLIYFRQKGEKLPSQLTIKGLENTFNISTSQTLDISEHGQKIIDEIRHKIGQIDKQLQQQYGKIDLIPTASYLKEHFNFEPENTYLFLHGHTLYNNFEVLVKRVVRGLANNKLGEILKIQAEDKVRKDKSSKYQNDTGFAIKLEREKEGKKEKIDLFEIKVETLLNLNYLRCLAFENTCFLIPQINNDIQKFTKLKNITA